MGFENDELRDQIAILHKEIKELRKKNESVEELESLFNQKDLDIAELNEKIQELKLASMRQKQ